MSVIKWPLKWPLVVNWRWKSPCGFDFFNLLRQLLHKEVVKQDMVLLFVSCATSVMRFSLGWKYLLSDAAVLHSNDFCYGNGFRFYVKFRLLLKSGHPDIEINVSHQLWDEPHDGFCGHKYLPAIRRKDFKQMRPLSIVCSVVYYRGIDAEYLTNHRALGDEDGDPERTGCLAKRNHWQMEQSFIIQCFELELSFGDRHKLWVGLGHITCD